MRQLPREGQRECGAKVNDLALGFPIKAKVHMVLRPGRPYYRPHMHCRLEGCRPGCLLWTLHPESRDLLEPCGMGKRIA